MFCPKRTISDEFLGHLRDMEALMIVVRVFSSDTVPHPEGRIDPAADLETILAELYLADMTIIENRLSKLETMKKKDAARRKEYEQEEASLRRFIEALEKDRPITSVEPTPEEITDYIRAFGLFSGREMMVLANVGDLTHAEEQKRLEDLPRWRRNTELLKKADEYVSKKLREIGSVKEDLDFLRNEVLKHLVAGEDDNKLVMATLLQGKGFIIILPGPPSIGKNYFADAFVECLDVYTTHRITDRGLEHIPEDEVEGKILYIKEMESLSDDPSHVMKSFYRDYQEDVEAFIITYPIKDPATGKQKSIKQELRVKGIITTTNLEWMDRSLLERAWIIDLDPSPEQTSRVLEFIGRDEDEKSKVKLGLLKWTSRQWSQALFYNLLKRIEDVEVWIPGREHIPKIVFRKRVNNLETRRDARRILKFLENLPEPLTAVRTRFINGLRNLVRPSTQLKLRTSAGLWATVLTSRLLRSRLRPVSRQKRSFQRSN